MTPRIENLPQKKLVGKSIQMSLADNKNFELFSSFMPQKKHIKKVVSSDVYEVMIYKTNYFKNFSPANTFTKWASVEVSDFESIPDDMEPYTLVDGLYAVFNYKGLAKDFGQLMRYILMEWLPNSDYILDSRPHFNVLGDKYKNNDPESEEEVWIPISLK